MKILLFLLFAIPLAAQQTPQYSLFMLNNFGWNPAFAGFDNSLSVTGVYRNQWNGLAGAPTTQQVNAHLPIYAINSGLGLLLESDAAGAHRTTSGLVAYNFQRVLGRETVLSVGASGGFSQLLVDGSLIRTPEGDYSNQNPPNHHDPILPDGKETAMAPTFGAGVFLFHKTMEFGLAAQQLSESKWGFAQNLTIKSRRTLAASAARTISISDDWKLKPTIFLKTDFVETQVEISAMLRVRENLLGGLSLRGFTKKNKDALIVFAGFKLNEKTTVAYAYDITLSGLNQVNRGSHELLLQYNLGKELGKGRLPSVIYNPRFQ